MMRAHAEDAAVSYDGKQVPVPPPALDYRRTRSVDGHGAGHIRASRSHRNQQRDNARRRRAVPLQPDQSVRCRTGSYSSSASVSDRRHRPPPRPVVSRDRWQPPDYHSAVWPAPARQRNDGNAAVWRFDLNS